MFRLIGHSAERLCPSRETFSDYKLPSVHTNIVRIVPVPATVPTAISNVSIRHDSIRGFNRSHIYSVDRLVYSLDGLRKGSKYQLARGSGET
jgi:hypothetical protein